MDTRLDLLNSWLSSQFSTFQLETMVGDASFRRYFRVKTGETTFVAMDAPPDKENNCVPFLTIAKTLNAVNIRAPKIFASDVTQGFLLMSDFGSKLLLKELKPENAKSLYTEALKVLSILSRCHEKEEIIVPYFTAEHMRLELQLFEEWFLNRYLNLTLTTKIRNQLHKCFDFLSQDAASQTQVFMHRDYHSANLMVLPQNEIGVLDFQDAFMGPVTYDLVSLLRDCYIDWPDSLVHSLVTDYWHQLPLSNVSLDEFIRWFDLMGLQRHMKALLTFSRKFCRDQNSNYLQHIPRTLSYLQKVSMHYPETLALHQFLNHKVLPCVQ